MRLSLQHKLLGSFMLVVALVLASVSAGVSLLIRDYFFDSKKREFTAKAYETARVVESYYAGQINYSQLAGFINSIDSLLGARVWVTDAALNIVAASEEQPGSSLPHPGGMKKSPMNCDMPGEAGPAMMQHGAGMGRLRPDRPAAAPALPLPIPSRNLADIQGLDIIKQQVAAADGAAWEKIVYHPYYEENMLVVGVPLTADNRTLGTVLIHAPLAGFDAFLSRIYWYLAAAGAVSVLVTIFIANYLAAGIIRPLKSMRTVAAAMAGGDYTARVRVTANDEVGDLSRSLQALGKALTDFVGKTEQTDKLRRDFVANVSHELRTPLTIIRGYNEALLDGTVQEPGQVARYHQIMRDEAVRLEKLIAGLLELSQLEARTAAFETEKVSLSEIVQNIVVMFGPRSLAQGISIITDIAGDMPDITGNGDRLTQLVVILLDNALKFTPPGGRICVTAAAAGAGAVLTIADTGAGIPAEDLPYIWERFYKADKAHTRTGGGTGLGLAIAREIISLHGAAAEVTSAPGQGTIFAIKFRHD